MDIAPEQALGEFCETDSNESAEVVARFLERPIKAHLLRLGIRYQDLDDLFQEVLFHIFNSSEKFNTTERLLPWACGIAKHVAMDASRARRRREARFTLFVDIPNARFIASEVSPDVLSIIEELRELLDSLPCEDRDIIERIFFCQESEQAIAELHHCHHTAISYHKQRILERLRWSLSPKSDASYIRIQTPEPNQNDSPSTVPHEPQQEAIPLSVEPHEHHNQEDVDPPPIEPDANHQQQAPVLQDRLSYLLHFMQSRHSAPGQQT